MGFHEFQEADWILLSILSIKILGDAYEALSNVPFNGTHTL